MDILEEASEHSEENKNPTQWFIERSKILEIEKGLAELKHKMRMLELEFERASSRLVHEQILERGRIIRAEERKTFMMKQQGRKQL
ncbi:MAG: hypothetical protein FJZ63_02130 [Chlamydiae bacterium]|nr:hypothetical protein [Chlamydiota bacterium]